LYIILFYFYFIILSKYNISYSFSNLFGSSVKPNDTGLGSGDSGGGVVARPRSIHYDPSSHQVGPSSIMKRRSMIEGGRYSRYEDDM